jgi:hypothetical protein
VATVFPNVAGAEDAEPETESEEDDGTPAAGREAAGDPAPTAAAAPTRTPASSLPLPVPVGDRSRASIPVTAPGAVPDTALAILQKVGSPPGGHDGDQSSSA